MYPEDKEVITVKKIKKLWNKAKKHGTIEEQRYWQKRYEGRVGKGKRF